MFGQESEASMDPKVEAKKEVLRTLISKMRVMMASPEEMSEEPEAPEMEGEESPMGMPMEEEPEGLEPEAVSSFMKKTNSKPVGAHSMLIASSAASKMPKKAPPFKKK
jgi:hypothetical protein